MEAPAGVGPLTIGALERETGVARGTIYYYLRYGLLPPAQKASATRSVYGHGHVELLSEIRRLQAEGRSLQEIRDLLGPRIEAAAEKGVDLVAKQNEDTRKTILEVAARRFAKQGYDKTRIVDICDEVGVTIQVLYAHFPSKHHLFIACYNVYYEWMRDQIEPHMAELADPTARLAWRAYASYGIQALSPALQVLARLQTIDPQSGLSDLLRETYTQMLSDVGEDLAAVGEAAAGGAGEAAAESDAGSAAARAAGGAAGGPGGDADAGIGDGPGGPGPAGPGPVTRGLFDDELVSYALLGALENMQVRASWDEKYDRLDVMRNLLAIHLAVRAAYAGRVDLTPDWEAVAELAATLAASTPKAEGPGA